MALPWNHKSMLEPTLGTRTHLAWRCLTLCLVMAAVTLLPHPALAQDHNFEVQPLPAPASGLDIVAAGCQSTTLIAIDQEGNVLTLPEGAEAWSSTNIRLSSPDTIVNTASTAQGLVLLRANDTYAELVSVAESGDVSAEALPGIPSAADRPLAVAVGDIVYLLLSDRSAINGNHVYRVFTYNLADPVTAFNKKWIEKPLLQLSATPLSDASVFAFNGTLYLFGHDAKGELQGHQITTTGPEWERHWKRASTPPRWSAVATGTSYGESHLFILVHEERASHLYAYHTITDRWVEYALPAGSEAEDTTLTARAGQPVLVGQSKVALIQPKSTPPRFRVLDYAVVGLYLLGMIGIGLWFTRRENSTDDFFRGGRRVPWWASGMSLFATLSSAISLMSMPRMGYASNWTYFAIGVGELLALPIAVWFLVPLVRRLNISTSNEYLERRFGVIARIMGSVIFILMQVGGRMAPVMLLPAIALEAITGIHVIYYLLIMGVITTVYTYLGGLEAVVWTDTIQGFVMVGTIVACLVIVFIKLDTPADVVVDSLVTEEKLKTFERHWSLVYPTMWIFLIYSFTTILMRLADQNFVQRVQCTPTLKQAKLAVVTQLGVAIPLNLLLFAVGTALWLFYRDKPELIDPTIKTDSIYPFFAAQQMPLGIAGLVVAALLAATMSTVSSSICSISDLSVSDFYKRFKPDASDHSCLTLGRSLTAVVGILGTATAIYLSTLSSMAVWDLSVLIINMIGLGVAGLFMLGLLTTRVSEAGAIIGMVVAFVAIFVMQKYGWPIKIHFFLITFIGSVVTFVVGYSASLVLPSRGRNLAGLTIFTLQDDEGSENANDQALPQTRTTT